MPVRTTGTAVDVDVEVGAMGAVTSVVHEAAANAVAARATLMIELLVIVFRVVREFPLGGLL